MGDTYKGLTIKLGGDASNLVSALATINSAAKTTQGRLRLVGQAMKADPSSAAALNSKLKLIKQQAEDASAKLKGLRAAYQQLGDQRVTLFNAKDGTSTERTVAEIAAETKNAALAAEQANSAYNAVDATLENVYKNIRDTANVDLRGKAREEIEGLREAGTLTDEQVRRVFELRDAWHQASDALDAAKLVSQFERMGIETETLEAQVNGFSRELATLDSKSSVAKQSSEFSELDAKIRICDTTLENLRRNGRMLDEALRVDPSNIGLVAAKVKNLKEQERAAADKAELLRQKLAAYDDGTIKRAADVQKNWTHEVENTRDAYARAEAALQKAQGELTALEQKQRELNLTGKAYDTNKLQAEIDQARAKVVELGASADAAYQNFDTAKACSEVQQLTTEMQQARTEAMSASSEIRNLGKANGLDFSGIRDLGNALYSTITPVVMQLGGGMKQAAQDVDSAFRDMKKTVSGTPEQFQELRDAAIEFSKTHVTSPDQLLEIEAMGGQLGIAAEDLKDFAKVASDLDIATDIDAQTIAQNLGQLSNVMSDLNHGNMQNFADALVRLGNNMPAQESAIMEVTTRIGSMGSILGMTTPQVLAWSTAIAATGQNSEAAGTAISKTMSDIETAVAGGGDALDGFARVANVSAEEFAATWKSSPSDALSQFVNGLRRIKDEGGSVDGALQELGITSVRQKQALEGLTQTTDVLSGALRMSQDAWDGVSDEWGKAGDAAREAEQKSEGFSGALAKLENIGKAFASTLGDTLTPFMSSLVDHLGKAESAFEGLPDGAKAGIVGMVAALGIVGPALKLVGGIGSAFESAASGANIAASAFKLMSRHGQGLQKALEGAMAATGNFENAASSAASVAGALKGGLVALAVAGVAVLAAKLYDAWSKQRDFNDALSAMGSNASGLSGAFASGSREVSHWGGVAKDAAMSTDELTSAIRKHNEKMSSIRNGAEESTHMLGEYKSVIDRLGGAHTASAEDTAMLEWALKGINEAFGTSYTAAQVLSGEYENQEGEIVNLIAEIDSLIAKKQQEAQVNAAQEGYTEALKNELQMKHNLEAAQEAYNARVAELSEQYQKAGTSAEAARKTAESRADGEGLRKSIENAEQAYRAAADETRVWAEEMTQAEVAASDLGRAMSDMLQNGDGWAGKLDDTGLSLEQMAGAAVKAGFSTETLSEVGADAFAKLAKSANGNTDTLIQRLTALNKLHLDPKTFTVSDDGTIKTETGHVIDLDAMTIDGKHFEVNDDGTISVAELGLDHIDARGISDKEFTVSARDNASWVIDDIATKAAKLAASSFTTVIRGAFGNAAGGIRYHADGMIATRPTWLGPRDIVGEAGAEAIIPLTNKRYVAPFAGTVAEEMLSKLSGITGGTQIDYRQLGQCVVDAFLASDVHVRTETGAIVGELASYTDRRGAMNLD